MTNQRVTRGIDLPIVALLALTACGGEGSPAAAPPVPATLAASPSQLALSDSAPTAKVFLAPSPSGGRLRWRLTAKPSWATVTPTEGEVAGGVMEVTVDASGLAQLAASTYSGRIEFVSDGGSAAVDVIGRSIDVFRLVTSPATIEVPESSDTLRFFVRNLGKSTVNLAVSSTNPWLTLPLTSSAVPRGDSLQVLGVVDREPLPAGATTGVVLLRAFGRPDSVRVPLTVRTAATAIARLGTSRVALNATDNSATVVLSNPGKGALQWNASPAAPWLRVTPASGSIAPGDSARLVVQADRALAPNTTVTSALAITSNATTPAVSLPVVWAVSPAFGGGMHLLDHRPIDAEGSVASGLIVTVSDSPARLTIVDALTGTTHVVPLTRAPTCVSIRPDGTTAAVGHDGAMTLVDLLGRRVVREYPVPVDILDLVLTNGDWAYAFPRRDQWTSIQSVRLSTGAVETRMNHPGIYAGTRGRLHPSGRSIYGSQNGIGPADHERYDIMRGPAERLYDSRYHGDYAMGGDAWFSEDGVRLFNRYGNVFSISSVQDSDMLYAGRLAPLTAIDWITDAPALDRILAVATSGGPMGGSLVSHDRRTFTMRGTVALPPFIVGASSVPAVARFAFAMGSRVFVIATSDPGAPTAQQNSIVVVERTQVP